MEEDEDEADDEEFEGGLRLTGARNGYPSAPVGPMSACTTRRVPRRVAADTMCRLPRLILATNSALLSTETASRMEVLKAAAPWTISQAISSVDPPLPHSA